MVSRGSGVTSCFPEVGGVWEVFFTAALVYVMYEGRAMIVSKDIR